MKKITGLLIISVLAFAGAVIAQQTEESPTKKTGHGEKATRTEETKATPKERTSGHATETTKSSRNAANAEKTPSETKQKAETGPKGRRGEKSETATGAETSPSTATSPTETGGKKGRHGRAETTPSTGASASPAASAGETGRKGRAGRNARASATPAASASAAASMTPTTRAATSATPEASAVTSASPETGASASAGAPGKEQGTVGRGGKRVEKQQIQQIKQQHASFKAQPKPNIAPAVTFNANYRISGAESWQGPQYEVFRSYHPEWHDRSWYHSHFSRVELIAGGWYYWNNGYWYPAWGYDPGEAYYAYNGPIYVGHTAEPPDKVIADVQAELKDMGYYTGEVDGLLGPLTRQALRDYQADHGLAVTEAIDEPTLNELDLT